MKLSKHMKSEVIVTASVAAAEEPRQLDAHANAYRSPQGKLSALSPAPALRFLVWARMLINSTASENAIAK